MMYADFAFYRDTFGGYMDEAEFNRLVRPASVLIDNYTGGRAACAHPVFAERIKCAACAVADELAASRGGRVASVNNDGYSETYFDDGRSPERRLYNAAALYLNETGLMYAGVDA